MAKSKAKPTPSTTWREIIAADAGECLHPITLKILADALGAGDIDGAIVKAYEIGVAVGAQTFRKLLESEHNRRYKKAIDDVTRKTDAQTTAETCCEEFAKFTPAEIKKFGLLAVYRDVGKFTAERLKRPQPIPPRTVRYYIEKAKRGNG